MRRSRAALLRDGEHEGALAAAGHWQFLAQLVQDPLTGRPLDGHARGDVPTTCGCQADDAGEHHEPGEDESPGRR